MEYCQWSRAINYSDPPPPPLKDMFAPISFYWTWIRFRYIQSKNYSLFWRIEHFEKEIHIKHYIVLNCVMVLSLTCSLLQQKEIAHRFPKVWFWRGVVAIAGEEWRGVGRHVFVSFVVLLFCCCCSLLLLFLLFSYNKQEDNTALVAFLQLQPSQCHSPEYKTGRSGRKEK